MKIALPLVLMLVSGSVLAGDDEIIIDDVADGIGIADSSDEITIDDEEPAPPVRPAFVPTTRLNSKSETGLSVDSAHEPAAGGTPEDYVEAWSIFRLSLRHQTAPGRSWRFAARLRAWGGWDHPDEGGVSKTILLSELTELRYDRRIGRDLVLQLGLQKIDWSVTDGMGPSLMFAPRDLRFGLAGELADSVLPVEAALVRYALSHRHDSYLELAFVPRHRPAEIRLFGTDWGMANPRQNAALPIGDIAWAIDPSAEDYWQNNLLYFTRPEFKPKDFSAALRLRGRLKGAELGVWGFYGFDLFPELRMDPSLAVVMAMMTGMGEGSLLAQMTPERIAALESFQAKMAAARTAGDSSELLTSVFARLAQIGAQVRRGYGRFVFAVESAWTPRFLGGRTLFSSAMEPIRGLATAHTALQIEYQSPPDLIVILGLSDLWVPDVANQPLMLLDAGLLQSDGTLKRPFDEGSAHLLTANLVVKAEFSERFEVLAALVSHPFQEDWMVMPALTYKLGGERHKLRLSAEFFGGPEGSMFGMFDHNDRIVIAYQRSY